MRIIRSIAMLVALAISSLMANSSASGAVVLPARTLEDNTYWSKFQICIAETACMYLESITLVSITTTKVKEKEKASKKRWSRDCR